jgi:hypothetical protein
MTFRAVDFDVDFAGLLAPGLTSGNGRIATTKYQYLVRGPL